MSNTSRSQHPGNGSYFSAERGRRWRRGSRLICLSLLAGLVLLIVFWNVFFRYVPPGKMLVVIAKTGDKMAENQFMAEPDQQGPQREVLGEGWHFVLPIVYTSELKDNVVIPPGKVGIVTARGGVAPRDGRVLADKEDERGIRRHVLLPGSYRLNPYGYEVELVNAVEIKPGFVGVQRRLLGSENDSRFARGPDQKGILHQVIQPGLYYLNTREMEVLPREVGIYQTNYHFDTDPRKNTVITFPVKDGYQISMDCTVEWEMRPEDAPDLAARYGSRAEVERNVIDQQARKISRDRGFNYGAQDFLEGAKREKFQEDFEKELKKVCHDKQVTVLSAFIRNIIIPESFLKPKRDKQLAVETKITNEAKQETAKSDAEVERERSMIQQSVANVQAETALLVGEIEQQVKNVASLTDAEIVKLKARYTADMAEMEAESKRVQGEAEASATKLKETAKSSIYKLKLDVFQNDGNAYLRYALADQLNPKMQLRLFHAGPGTLWTNLEGKNLNLLLNPMGQPKP
jgi:hypothetical protein